MRIIEINGVAPGSENVEEDEDSDQNNTQMSLGENE